MFQRQFSRYSLQEKVMRERQKETGGEGEGIEEEEAEVGFFVRARLLRNHFSSFAAFISPPLYASSLFLSLSFSLFFDSSLETHASLSFRLSSDKERNEREN